MPQPRNPQLVQHLLTRHPIISDQIQRPALAVVLSELSAVLAASAPGDVAEFGCYIGTTSLFIRRILNAEQHNAVREFHVYDSFQGLPPKQSQDSSTAGDAFRAGELSVSRRQLFTTFHSAHLQPPIVHKAWFGDLTAPDVPDQLAFAFLDGDFYTSILDSLRLVWPRMAPGGRICIDDFQREALPGVTRAVHDYFQATQQGRTRDIRDIRVAHNIGIIHC